MEVERKLIKEPEFKARSWIDPNKLAELVESIKSHGIIQPIILRKKPDGQLELVIGSRRLKAAEHAGLEKIPAIIREMSDREALEAMLIENVHREDLSEVDKGKIVKELMQRFPKEYPSIAQVAKRIGVSERTVRTWLKLAEAPKAVQEIVAPSVSGKPVPKGMLDYTTAARILTKLPDKAEELAMEISRHSISTTQAKKLIEEVAKKPDKSVREVVEEFLARKPEIELPFDMRFKEAIIRGIKRMTTRRALPKPIKEGDIVYASFHEHKSVKLKITAIRWKRLGEFTEEDAKAEGFSSLDEFKHVWEELYGPWNENEPVVCIEFEKVD